MRPSTRTSATLVECDGAALPFPGDSFDRVLSGHLGGGDVQHAGAWFVVVRAPR